MTNNNYEAVKKMVEESIWNPIGLEGKGGITDSDFREKIFPKYYPDLNLILDNNLISLSDLIQIMFEVKNQRVFGLLSGSYDIGDLNCRCAIFDQLMLQLIKDHSYAMFNTFTF